MQHIDVFLIAKYGKEIFPALTEDSLPILLTQYYEIPFTHKDIKYVLMYEPKKTHIVKALRDKGFTQAKISQLTGLKQPAVSYHIHKETKTTYINPHLREMLDKNTLKPEY